MEFHMYNFKSLIHDMKKNNQDIDKYTFVFNSITFELILDISYSPYDILIGARAKNWACTLKMFPGYTVSMSDKDFYSLCNILNLKPSKDSFTSFKFLKYINDHAPRFCSSSIVRPSDLMPYRKNKIKKTDEADKTVFWGWNDHQIDKRKAQNFAKTELFFGKRVADYCREKNISSIWHKKQNGIIEKTPTYPNGFN